MFRNAKEDLDMKSYGVFINDYPRYRESLKANDVDNIEEDDDCVVYNEDSRRAETLNFYPHQNKSAQT